MFFVKKFLSSFLAIILTATLLITPYSTLNVYAEESETEIITIGGTDYEIYTDKKYAGDK